MKRIYLRFRILLMTFALGVAVVYMTSGLSIAWSEVPVELPKAEATDVFPIIPINRSEAERGYRCGGYTDEQAIAACTRAKIVESRDMSLYELGNNVECCSWVESGAKWRGCRRSLAKAREFVWSHWQQKKRGYIVVTMCSVDAASDAYIFIEPDEYGRWRIRWTCERVVAMFQQGEVDVLSDTHAVEWKRGTGDHGEFETGTRYLRLITDEGYDLTL